MNDLREGRTLRLPSELWQRVSELARGNRRSTTKELQVAVERHVAHSHTEQQT